MPQTILALIVVGLFVLGLVTLHAKVGMLLRTRAIEHDHPGAVFEASRRSSSDPDEGGIRGWENEGGATRPDSVAVALDTSAESR